MDEKTVPKEKDHAQLKTLNRWLMALVAFIVIWVAGLYFYIDTETHPKPPIPVISIDPITGKITNAAQPKLLPNSTNTVAKPMFEQKDSYDKMDFVIINYFFISGLVVDRHGNDYTIMYKDSNHVIQKIIVPKELLLSPTSAYAVNPASLLVP